MALSSRLYLDHAATSWPKSPAVLGAMHDYASQFGATAGRGAYRSAQCAEEIVASARRGAARLIGSAAPNNISFHASGTAALNTGIFGWIQQGDHVVTTQSEHNSVLRPLEAARKRGMIDVTCVECDPQGRVAPDAVLDAISDTTSLVAIASASNVTGCVQPIREIADALEAFRKRQRIAFLVDGAQTVGWMEMNVSKGIDLLAAPMHKAVGAPFGTAILHVAEHCHSGIEPVLHGGTGTRSDLMEMPSGMPDKLEAGNLNVPAIAGLVVAIEETARRRSNALDQLGRVLSESLHHGLAALDGVDVIGDHGPIPVVSFQVNGQSPQEVAAILDSEFAIEVRSGFHCAALIHGQLRFNTSGQNSSESGTVRVSAGHSTTIEEIERFTDSVAEISSASCNVSQGKGSANRKQK
ncbi:MAG: aminotransferase class V-fold PLP-dependent enzyme [Planctomycetota bacterium]